MLITVVGNRIDTKQIYRIGKIDNYFNTLDPYLGFKIYFLNEKDMIIKLYLDKVANNNLNADNFETIKLEAQTRIEKCRDQITLYWGASKSDIPVVEL